VVVGAASPTGTVGDVVPATAPGLVAGTVDGDVFGCRPAAVVDVLSVVVVGAAVVVASAETASLPDAAVGSDGSNVRVSATAVPISPVAAVVAVVADDSVVVDGGGSTACPVEGRSASTPATTAIAPTAEIAAAITERGMPRGSGTSARLGVP
jgi:hypothetical protein